MKIKQKSDPQSVVVLNNPAERHAVVRMLALSRKTKPVTVTQAVNHWLDWLRDSYSERTGLNSATTIRAWARDMKLNDTPVQDVTVKHINNWVNAEDSGKLGNRQFKLSVIRSFFKFVSIKEWLTGPDPSRLAVVKYNQIPHRQKETREVDVFDTCEFMEVLGLLSRKIDDLHARIKSTKLGKGQNKLIAKRQRLLFWKCATIIGRCVGLRLGDICQLEWASFDHGKFIVWTDKRNKRVDPYIWNRELFVEMQALIPFDTDTQYCFPHERKIHLSNRRASLSVEFGRLCQQAELKGRHTFHGLRHTYATECGRMGIPTPHIARSLGHSSTKTTEGYMHG